MPSNIPPWAWGLGAVGAGVAVYLYKKEKEAKALSEISESSTETEVPTTPAVEQYPYSAGEYGAGGGGYGGAIGEAAESQNQFRELFGQLTTSEKEQSTAQAEDQKSIAEQLRQSEQSITEILSKNTSSGSNNGSTVSTGSGGGAPTETPKGVTPAPPSGGSKTPAAETVKNIKCPNGCEGHEYSPSGRVECQTKTKGPVNAGHPKGLYCTWPS